MRMQTGSPAEVVTAEAHPVKEGHQFGPESAGFGRPSAQYVFQVSLSLKTQPNLDSSQRIGTEPNGLHLMLLTEMLQAGATPMGDVMGRPLTRFEGPPTKVAAATAGIVMPECASDSLRGCVTTDEHEWTRMKRPSFAAAAARRGPRRLRDGRRLSRR